MKHTLNIALVLLLCAATSCIKEQDTGIGKTDGPLPVKLNLQLPSDMKGGASSRSMAVENESAISSVELLAFLDDGSVNFRYTYSAPIESTVNNNGQVEIVATAQGYSGQQVFMVLVNAPAGASSGIVRNMALADARQQLLVASANEWNAASSADYKPLPMYAETSAATISVGATLGNYDLVRMLARIDVRLKAGVSNFVVTEAHLFNRKTSGQMAFPFDAATWDAAGRRVKKTTYPQAAIPSAYKPSYYDISGYASTPYGADYTDDSRGEILRSVYTFEAKGVAEADRLDATAVVVGGKYNGSNEVTYYRVDIKTDTKPAGYVSQDILRNHLYDIEIQSVAGAGAQTPEDAFIGKKPIDFTVSVTNWGAENRIPLPWAMTTVSPDEVLLSYSAQTPAPQTIAVNCTYNDGSPAKNLPWTLSVPAADAAWLKLSLNADGSNAQTTVSGTESKTVYLVVTANNSTTNTRSTGLLLNDETVVAVTQSINLSGVPNTPLANTYVGAFWRADQTGERIIRIPNVTGANIGNWTASVVWMDSRWIPGDIVLASGGSSDPNVNYATVMTPGNAEDYPVTGDATSISGTVASGGNIIFRIGLKSNYTATEDYPARYAVLLIAYGSPVKYQKIYLRQGHDPDRLMRPENTYSKQFSPYNLTATTLDAQVDLYGTQGSNPSKFTDYPTQAGAFFQWAGTTSKERIAYNAHITTQPTGWLNSYPTTYWNTLDAVHETCPTGYRRPNDGIITGNEAANTSTIASSEMRQSLYEVPPTSTIPYTGNSVRGYYADGFFDRRAIVNSPTGTASSAVSAANEKVAYVGHLFYNSTTNASLFFPASGHRSHDNGTLTSAGINGYYWSNSTSSTTAYGWALYVLSPINAYQNNTAIRSYGFPIRCIRDN